MKWFKHISKSRFDAKIMRLIRKHGLRGYGLYFAILEGIAFDLEPEKPLPELEQTAHDIADFFGEDTVKIEEIVQDCIGEGLFDINGETGSIRCLKLLTYLDNTMSQNPQIRAILDNFNRNESKKIKETLSPLKQIRLDKTILDKIIQDEVSNNNKNATKVADKPKLYDLPIPENLKTDAFIATWKRWIDYKRKTTRISIDEATATLAWLSGRTVQDAIDCIETAIRNGWKGCCFEPKNKFKQEHKKAGHVDKEFSTDF